MELRQVEKDWTTLGANSPLWAVLTGFGKRGEEWRSWSSDAFMATGTARVDADLRWMERLGVSPESGRALDFGCGVGRLSNALARHFDEVVAVDISEPMLARARRLDTSGGRIRFLHNNAPDLRMLESESFDLVYTDRVLQHLPTSLAREYLREMARVTRPGGVLFCGIPDRAQNPVFGMLVEYAPLWLNRAVQRGILGFPAPMRMHTMTRPDIEHLLQTHGCTLLASEDAEEPLWRHLWHVAVKDTAQIGRAHV